MNLLSAGARSEEIEAERARLARSTEESHYLHDLQNKRTVRSTIQGVVATPHLAERIGQYFHEGELICLIEQPGALEAELVLADQNWNRVKTGQSVEFRPRDCPRLVMHGVVERIAPRAARGEAAGTSTVTVYCSVTDADPDLRAGTVGHARITCSRRPICDVLIDRLLILLRADVWW